LRNAIFYTRLYSRTLRPGLAIIFPARANPTFRLATPAAETAFDKWYDHVKIAA